jgi:steroid 5-alpha reductase family enzyme
MKVAKATSRAWSLVLVVAAYGIAIVELVADVQLHRFIRDRRAGEVMDRGMWSWSRHPNYFGEFSFWVALALFGIAAPPSDAWWLCLGALAMLGMFLGGSIPMMETRSLQRRPVYQDVIDRVSRFVPCPPKRGRREVSTRPDVSRSTASCPGTGTGARPPTDRRRLR